MKPRMSVKVESEEEQGRLAVLIDADNAQPSVIEGLLAEVAKFGIASVKRIYGDWTSPQHKQWKDCLLKYSLTPVQQFAFTKGKNATDSSLIIDAMDLLYTRRFDGFCLVSSDSDFTRLAQRLREEGMMVFGFGEKKTPEPFISACDKFIFTEILRPEQPPVDVSTPALKPSETTPVPSASPQTKNEISVSEASSSSSPEWVDFIMQAIRESSDETGWIPLSALGSYLTKIKPGFDPRLYGSKKLSELLKRLPLVFRMEEKPVHGGNGKTLSVHIAEATETPKK
jgi:uncharacterized LabA/DUF88 family protein